MSTFKKFTPQDYSIVPFNAHKQYNFTSASAASNQVTYFNTKFTSESISKYSSASAVYGGDTINNTKYNQLDNLFYRNFNKLSSLSTGKKYLGQDTINYLKHKRVLYKEANVLSIPAGLYGHEIKPKSLFISASEYEFKDDGLGNLMLESDDINNYETDVRTNILNIGPTKGFEKYDLNIIKGYISFNGYENSVFYRDGQRKLETVSSYSTPDFGDEYDDSYFYNRLFYKNVTFSEQTLFRGNFPTIGFNGTDSEIKLGHKGDFNFNNGDEFTISFWANIDKPKAASLTFAMNAVSASNDGNENLTLISSDGTTKTYRSSTSAEGTVISSGIISFRGKIQNATTKAERLRDAINSANGHNGKLVAGAVGSTVTINQLDSLHTVGTIGNTNVTATSQFNTLVAGSVASAFSGGTDSDFYLFSKSTTKEGIPNNYPELHNSASNPYELPYEIPAEPQFPFEIYTFNREIFFKRSDGEITTIYSASYTPGIQQHIAVRYANTSEMDIFINGRLTGSKGFDKLKKQTQNTANIYIGSKGGSSKFFSGSLSQINVFNKRLSPTQILNHYSSSNNSPYIGNVFYQNGFITITHPSYITALNTSQGSGMLNTLQFQGSHLLYENEYKCTIEEHEFNHTSNISARKIGSKLEPNLANFATGSNFTPYVTTVGLYNEDNELLVIGKLASPIRMSNETDTTFVLRWDT